MRTRAGRLYSHTEIERWAVDTGLSSGVTVTPDGPPYGVEAVIHHSIDCDPLRPISPTDFQPFSTGATRRRPQSAAQPAVPTTTSHI
jgi:hypothetical protein